MHPAVLRTAAAAALLAAAFAAKADIFVEIPGIDGGSTDAIFQGAITASGVSGNFASRSCGDLVILKQIDQASPLLIAAAVEGQQITEATITYRVDTGEIVYNPVVLLLQNTRIKSVSTEVIDETMTTRENLVIQAGLITIEQQPLNEDGSLGQPVSRTLDCGKPK